jgi:hypothetical protein
MSTTIKRVALVAVAALGLGVVSVAPSTAAQTAAQSYIYCSQADGGAISNTTTTGATCGGIAGASNFVTLTGVQTTKDVELTVSGSTFVAQSGSTFVTNTAGTVALASAANANTTIKVATPAAGTITVTVKYSTAGSGIFTASTETVVITVGTTALSGTYSAAESAVYLVAGETFSATADATTAISKVKTYVSTDSATASIVAYYKDGLGNAITNDTLTATITSGPGTVWTKTLSTGTFDSVTAYNQQSSNSVGSYSVSSRADLQGRVAFFVYANGQVGVSTITVRNTAGTVLSTKTVTFTDTVIASITATVLKANVQGDSTSPTTNVIKLTLKDAAGNAITSPAAYPTVTSSATTLGTGSQTGSAGVADTATANSAGEVFWGFTPAAAASYGPVTLTFTAGLVSTTASINLSSAVAATFTASAANTAANGDVVYTITAKDAKGYAVPDGLALSNYVASVASVGTAGSLASQTGLTDTSKGGVWTTTAVSAPSSSTEITTTFTLTGTAGTANSYLAKTLTGTKVAATFAVSNPSIDAATDAANEAAQAASDATDAALAAADAADAATTKAQEAVDAVATLSAQVSKLITALKAQITTLTNLVIKIQKKVKA